MDADSCARFLLGLPALFGAIALFLALAVRAPVGRV